MIVAGRQILSYLKRSEVFSAESGFPNTILTENLDHFVFITENVDTLSSNIDSNLDRVFLFR